MKNSNQFAPFYMLLNRMGLKAVDRRDFIMDYSEGKYSRLSELYNNNQKLYFKMLSYMQNKTVEYQKINNMDMWRKRVMASIGGYLEKCGRESNNHIIKGIACNATGYGSFNEIPLQRLINIYNTFLNKQKDIVKINNQVDASIFETPCAN